MEKRVAVLGCNGQIGTPLVKYLKSNGYWVRGVDIESKTYLEDGDLDEFVQSDLTIKANALAATKGVDEVYQLAAKMGGMGFISSEHIASLHDSNLINTYVPWACVKNKVERVFFSSSQCVYPVHYQNTTQKHLLFEEDVIPANPNEAYGWEKLMAEFRYLAYFSKHGLEVRIARFGNTYGEYGKYDGGREKAPAALCRKAILAKDGDKIEVWGDGKAVRSFMYVGDLVEGIHELMRSDVREPVNLGSDEHISIQEFAKLIINISNKNLVIKNIDGPEGVRTRFISHDLAKETLGWSTKTPLSVGIPKLYKWIESQLSA